MKARHRPSAHKIDYLRSLKEYLLLLSVRAKSNVENLIQQLHLLAPTLTPSEVLALTTARAEIQLYMEDILYLSSELSIKAAEIDPAIATIMTQIDLHGRTRAYVLTIMVSLYVPLAFVSVSAIPTRL